jgi:hypothetical protein
MLVIQAVTISDCTRRNVGWLLSDDLVGISEETLFVCFQGTILGFVQSDWGRQRPRYEPVTSGIQVYCVTATLGCSVPSGVECTVKCKSCGVVIFVNSWGIVWTVLRAYHDGAVARCLTSHMLFHGTPRVAGCIHYRGFKITLRHTTHGRTPLDELLDQWSDLYMTLRNAHNRKTAVPPVWFEPAIS